MRPAEGRVALLRARRPAGQGRRRAAAGLRRDELRAGPAVRQRAGLPRPARRLVREGQRAHPQDAARAADRPARRGAPGDGAAAGGDARHRAALGDAGPARSVSADRHQRLLAGPAPGRSPRRGPRRPAARSGRSCWTPARSPATTRASFARHRTITALEHARALRDGRQPRARPRSRSARWPATTR